MAGLGGGRRPWAHHDSNWHLGCNEALRRCSVTTVNGVVRGGTGTCHRDAEGDGLAMAGSPEIAVSACADRRALVGATPDERGQQPRGPQLAGCARSQEEVTCQWMS